MPKTAYLQTIALTHKHKGSYVSIAWVTINGLFMNNTASGDTPMDSEYQAVKALNKYLSPLNNVMKLPTLRMSHTAAYDYIHRVERTKPYT